MIAPTIANSQQVGSNLTSELRFISDEAFAIGIVRPAKMFSVKGIADIPLADVGGKLGLKPSEVEYCVVASVPGYNDAALVFSLKANKPLDQGLVRRLLSPKSKQLEHDKEFPCFDGQGSGGMTLIFPSPEQVVFSSAAGPVFDALTELRNGEKKSPKSVSYTHLTLPTICSV